MSGRESLESQAEIFYVRGAFALSVADLKKPFCTPPANEKLTWFLEDLVLREPDALCACHYLFARYRKWRTDYGLLRTQLSQADFA